MVLLTRSRPYRFQISGDYGNAEIRKAYARGIIDNVHEYVKLVGCQYIHGQWNEVLWAITYPFEISVNHIAGVKVFEALRGIG